MEENPRPGSIVREVGGTLWRFTRGQAIISAILTAFHLAGFYAIGLPWWALSGLVVGVLTLIPYFGFMAGAVLAALFTLLAGGGLWDLVRMLLVMAAAQALEGLYLTPRILGRELNLHPLLVFAAVIVGLVFFGPLGAFLAAPAVAVALVLWRRASRSAAARRQR